MKIYQIITEENSAKDYAAHKQGKVSYGNSVYKDLYTACKKATDILQNKKLGFFTKEEQKTICNELYDIVEIDGEASKAVYTNENNTDLVTVTIIEWDVE